MKPRVVKAHLIVKNAALSASAAPRVRLRRRKQAPRWKWGRILLRPRYVHYSIIRRALFPQIERLLYVNYFVPKDKAVKVKKALSERFIAVSKSPAASLAAFFQAGGTRSKYNVYMDRGFFLQHFFYILPNLRRLPQITVRSRASTILPEFSKKRCYIYRGRRFKALLPSPWSVGLPWGSLARSRQKAKFRASSIRKKRKPARIAILKKTKIEKIRAAHAVGFCRNRAMTKSRRLVA